MFLLSYNNLYKINKTIIIEVEVNLTTIKKEAKKYKINPLAVELVYSFNFFVFKNQNKKRKTIFCIITFCYNY